MDNFANNIGPMLNAYPDSIGAVSYTHLGTRIYPSSARRIGHSDRAGRDQCLRRAAATPVHRPSAAQKTMHSDTGRFHVCSRFYHGTPYFRYILSKIPEHHRTAGSAADFIRAKCRPHHRSGWVPHLCSGNACGTAAKLRYLPSDLRFPTGRE